MNHDLAHAARRIGAFLVANVSCGYDFLNVLSQGQINIIGKVA